VVDVLQGRGDSIAVAALPRTWGSIKALYR
jgi:hypothetical protein